MKKLLRSSKLCENFWRKNLGIEQGLLNKQQMSSNFFIKLALPQAAWLGIFFVGKPVVLYLFEGPELRMYN